MHVLTVGHFCKDLTPDGFILGGTPAYSGTVYSSLGVKNTILTSYASDLGDAVRETLQPDNITRDVVTIPSFLSTTFENIYDALGNRTAKLYSVASHIYSPNVRELVTNRHRLPVDFVHLAPMANEFRPDILTAIPGIPKGLTIQGWLIGQDDSCNVILRQADHLFLWLPLIDIVVLSLEDCCGDHNLLQAIIRAVPICVETLSSAGCRVYTERGRFYQHIPVEPVTAIDPTGAGDVFAAAFFMSYMTTKDTIWAAQFANYVASKSVLTASIPELAERLKQEVRP